MTAIKMDAHALHVALVMDESRRHTARCRRERVCVWCEEPVPDRFTYPACEECREHKGVVAA